MRLDWRMPQVHWPNLGREQTERLALGAGGVVIAALLLGGVYALFTGQIPGWAEFSFPEIKMF